MTDFCKYVDVFYGSGEVTSFPETGAASKWFAIKALCGNTTPHAALPFSKMSVGAYSGGYPTGYGTHCPNFCGRVPKLSEKMKIRGFSHLHQSGTGAIDYYYNYAVTTPFYGGVEKIGELYEAENESARPGEYSTEMNGTRVRLTVSGETAFHEYVFKEKNGRIAVDFSNDGLSKSFGKKYYAYPENVCVRVKDGDTVLCRATLSGVTLFFCVRAFGENVRAGLFSGKREKRGDSLSFKKPSKSFGAVFDFDGKKVLLKLACSTTGFENAEAALRNTDEDFTAAAENAYRTWNTYLSAVRIETQDSALKEKFYSCFYHSLIKPAVMTGENVLGVCGDTVCDFATFWDQYKTLLPLIFMLYMDVGRKIADGVVNISRTLGKIPCSFGLSDMFPCEKQAKMLGIIALCDAYYAGLCEKAAIDECTERELERKEIKKFIRTGYFERYTHISDAADACADVARITENEELKKRLSHIASYSENAYASDGLLSENSRYYEGDRYTYSFRLQNDMTKRIALAGGKEKFASLLDNFFGFGKDSVRQLTEPEKIKKAEYHRFEGFNNECDMEAPFAYIFAQRHDRLCEIVSAAVNDTFKTGRGGLPGNNDSGGLSSCFMWLVLGIFPCAGQGKYLLGCPQIEKAEITLSSGNTLKIKTERKDASASKVKEVYFNGEKVNDFTLSADEVFGGGEIKFIFD